MLDPILKAGKVIDDRYELVRRLGSGAIGVVWLARDRASNLDVALKLLHPKLTNDPNAIAQLEREAAVLDKLDHPHIAKMYAFQASGPSVYLSIEYVDGMPLQELISEHTKDNQFFRHREVWKLFSEICSAVSYAHQKMIVHRDLKPHNIMIVRDGELIRSKILDFGIARLLEGSIFDATTFGRQLGSLFYMSPEQTRGEPADVRSDVFGLASILFEILTLHRTWARAEGGYALPAFAGPVPHGEMNSIAAVFTRISLEDRPRPSEVRPALPESFDRIIVKALSVKAADRHQSVDELVREMRDAFLQLSDFETRTELGHGPPSPIPKTEVDDDDTRLEDAAGPEDATQLLEASNDYGFSDLTEAAPTDKKPARRIVPETLEYRRARLDMPLEEAGPTVRASGPIKVTELHVEGLDSGLMDVPLTRSIERAVDLVDPSESGEAAVPDEELPPTGEMAPIVDLPPTAEVAEQSLRLPFDPGLLRLRGRAGRHRHSDHPEHGGAGAHDPGPAASPTAGFGLRLQRHRSTAGASEGQSSRRGLDQPPEAADPRGGRGGGRRPGAPADREDRRAELVRAERGGARVGRRSFEVAAGGAVVMVWLTVRAKKSIAIKATKASVFEVLKDVPRSGRMFPGVRLIEDQGSGKYLWVLDERRTLGKTFLGRYTTQHENNGTDEVRWKTIEGNVKTSGVWRIGGRDGAVELSVESEVEVEAPVPSILKKPAEIFAEKEQSGGIEEQLQNIRRAVER